MSISKKKNSELNLLEKKAWLEARGVKNPCSRCSGLKFNFADYNHIPSTAYSSVSVITTICVKCHHLDFYSLTAVDKEEINNE